MKKALALTATTLATLVLPLVASAAINNIASEPHAFPNELAFLFSFRTRIAGPFADLAFDVDDSMPRKSAAFWQNV
jgi:hypothetical protein